MDFLDIRKKAKERAQARVAGDPPAKARPAPASPAAPPPRPRRGRAAAAPGAAAPPRRASPAPPDLPVLTDEDVLEGALAARLQGLPAPGDPLPAPLPGERRRALHHLAPRRRRAAGRRARTRPWRRPRRRRALRRSRPPRIRGAGAAPRTRGPARRARRRATGPTRRARPPRAATRSTTSSSARTRRAPRCPRSRPRSRLAAVEEVVLAREEFLTFLLGGEEYAVAIARVREVVQGAADHGGAARALPTSSASSRSAARWWRSSTRAAGSASLRRACSPRGRGGS